ncbi:hypothetical protein A9Q91_03205 [Candidatus Gracilibacteria bacterium 28_42_T64]|nr:hypothetical protein A9Q91_03205 [Candidatus Gracilibacteria bacterium 28_42_T64]
MILLILSTIGLASYISYLSGIRDTARVSQLAGIHDGLELYKTSRSLPLPDDYVKVQANGVVIGYQGYAGETVLEAIEYTQDGKDPKDKVYYSYYVSINKKHFQLLTLLEKNKALTASVNTTFAATDYTDRYPYTYGKKLGILVDSDNTPIQEVSTIQSAGNLDITSTTDTYTAYIDNTEKVTGSGVVLIGSNPTSTCKRIKDIKGSSDDGIYTIDPEGNGTGFDVYCDMTSDGGGWTYVAMSTDITTENLFETGSGAKITSIKNNIGTKGNISDIWKDNENKDLMLKCSTTNEYFKSYEIPTFIYGFKKSDISHLTKSNKESSTFSSTSLEAKWNGDKYYLTNTYGSSTGSGSVELIEASTGDFKYIFRSYKSRSMRVYNSSSALGAALYTTYYNQDFDINNYCMVAIR